MLLLLLEWSQWCWWCYGAGCAGPCGALATSGCARPSSCTWLLSRITLCRPHPARPPSSAPGMLQDRAQAQQLARLLDPLVRAVDGAVGEKVAMLVEVEYEGGLGVQAPCGRAGAD